MQTFKFFLTLLFALIATNLAFSFQEVPNSRMQSQLDGLIEEGKDYLKLSQFDLALVQFEEAAMLLNQSSNIPSIEWLSRYDLEIQNWIGYTQGEEGNYDEGLAILRAALLKSMNHLPDSTIEIGINYHFQGKNYRHQRLLKQAGNAFMLAKRSYSINPKESILWRIRLENDLGYLSYNQYNYEKGVEHCEKALQLAKAHLKEDDIEFVIINNTVGNIYNDQNEIEKANRVFFDALTILENIRAKPHQRFGILYSNIARHHKTLGNWDSVLYYNTLALNNDKALFANEHAQVAKDYSELGVANRMLFQYNEAKAHFEQALAIRIQLFGEVNRYVADNYTDLGLVSMNMNDLDAASSYLQRSLQIYLQTLGSTHSNTGICYQNLGVVRILKKQPEQAISYQQQALEIFKKAKAINNEVNLYGDMGATYFQLGDKKQGEKYFLKAIEGYKKLLGVKNGILAGHYEWLASELEQVGDYEQALQNYHLAANAISIDQEEKDWTKIKTLNGSYFDEGLFYQIVAKKAKTLQLIRNHEKGNSNIDLAIKEHYEFAIDKFFDYINSMDRKIDKNNLVNQALDMFEGAIQSNLEQRNHAREAFVFSERYKNILLLQAIGEAEAEDVANLPLVLSDRMHRLKQKISNLEKELYQSEQSKQVEQLQLATLKSQIFTTHQSLDSLNTVLEQNYPAYYQLKYQSNIADVSSIQENLKDNQLLLEYFIGNENIYAFTISKKQYQVHQIEKNFNLNALVQSLQKNTHTYHLSAVRSDQMYQNYADSLVQVAHELYQKIFEPIANKVDLPEELIIVPDGILGYVPFELLIQELPQENILFGGHRYLIQDHQISYSYSATLLQEMKQKNHNRTKGDFIAFAPAFEEEVVYADASNQLAEIRGGLSPLKYNISEVQALQQFLKGKLFTGKNATAANFNQFAPDYKIIHLATHGKANDRVGDYAYLAFSEIKDSIENELLYNRDLYNLQLNAEMVVLSACETGIGELQRGEGIISLARGFSYAGAKSIITTLWSVNDEKTKELMESFYRYIKAGKTKDAALRQAKLDFITQHAHEAHPFYWAAFVPVGDMAAIELEGRFGNGWWLGAIAFLGILLLYWWQRKASK